MADENAEQVTPGEEVVPEVSTGFVAAIKTEVATKVTNDLVHEQFIGGLVTEKITARAATLKKAFELLQKHSGELNKLRAKSPGFDENEKALPKTFSAEDVKKRKEYKEKSDRLEKAIAKATDAKATEAEWRALDEALAKNG